MARILIAEDDPLILVEGHDRMLATPTAQLGEPGMTRGGWLLEQPFPHGHPHGPRAAVHTEA